MNEEVEEEIFEDVNEIEIPISVEEYTIDIQDMSEETGKLNFNLKWNLQIKIWCFVLLILSIVSIPFIFISGKPIENLNTKQKTGIKFFLGFNWEPCVMFIISFPTSLIGILSSFTKKTIFVKFVFKKKIF